jgi:hypothetical protein
MLEDAARAEPADRSSRRLLPRAASANLAQSALHIAGRKERTAVGVERLELILLEAAEQVQRERMNGVPLVTGQLSDVGNECAGELRKTELRTVRAPVETGGTPSPLIIVREGAYGHQAEGFLVYP